jgi:diaminopimelate decarboxylase
MGAEVASPGELKLALAAGFKVDKIIFDSPAKTIDDLRTCLKHNISLNIDNMQELERMDTLIKEYPDTGSRIGFRVNPQIGSGQISSTSTATKTSKFGFPLGDGDNAQLLKRLYLERPWLTSIHTHTGSQGCPLELMVKGIDVITDFAEDINSQLEHQQIDRIDIGGGLPVNFSSDEVKPTFAEYAALIEQHVPILFTDKYQVKTEFGRAIAAKNGFIVTRVEYTKQAADRHIAITHAGAQIITRTVFLPQCWPIRVTGYSPDGKEKTGNPVNTDVAGPCCFAADLIAKDITLPKLEPNDYVIAHDTGAYYFSNHFDYNSLPRVAVYAASKEAGALGLTLIRRAGTLEDIVRDMS